jgi:hypothetical protein
MSFVRAALVRFMASMLLVLGFVAQPALAAKEPKLYVAQTDVTYKNKKMKRGPEVADALRKAAMTEAAYYDPSYSPVVMRVQIEKMSFKSVGKAVLEKVPVVGMFSGKNRNFMQGRVELVDQQSGKSLKKYKIKADDNTQVDLGDAAFQYGKLGVSFLPFGSLFAAAMDVADSAANKRERAEEMLTNAFVMLSYQKAYGKSVYKGFAPQRKAAFELARAEKKAKAAQPTVPATGLAATPAGKKGKKGKGAAPATGLASTPTAPAGDAVIAPVEAPGAAPAEAAPTITPVAAKALSAAKKQRKL